MGNFQGKFQLLRNRVEDRSPNEEYRILLDKLPDYWKRQVIKEEAKRKKNKFSVRIANCPPRTAAQLQNELVKFISSPLNPPTPTNNGWIVSCEDEVVFAQLLSINNCTLQDKVLRVSKFDLIMDSDAICDFVTDGVAMEEKANRFVASFSSTKHANAIDTSLKKHTPSLPPSTPKSSGTPRRNTHNTP